MLGDFECYDVCRDCLRIFRLFGTPSETWLSEYPCLVDGKGVGKLFGKKTTTVGRKMWLQDLGECDKKGIKKASKVRKGSHIS